MNTTKLKAAGRLLWGERYVSAMARALDVSVRTAQRWDDGQPIPDYVEGKLRELLDRRVVEIEKMMAKLKAAA